MLAIKDHLSRGIDQLHAEVHQGDVAARPAIDRHDLESACHDIAHEDRLQEAAALLRQCHHGIPKPA